MEKGKIIVIEGTDCSGKETQSKMLIDRLNNEGIITEYFSFPNYSSPTGRIVGLPYLGKEYLAEELIESKKKEVLTALSFLPNYNPEYAKVVLEEVKKALGCGWFSEGAPKVDAKISSLYYAADRAYNINAINDRLEQGINVILDRYFYSNMAHQGGKILEDNARKEMFEWIYTLESVMLGLPDPNLKLFLHMPTEYTSLLKSLRSEKLDENERDLEHLKHAEKTYLEVAHKYGFDYISCISNDSVEPSLENIKTREEINDEVYDIVIKKLKKRN